MSNYKREVERTEELKDAFIQNLNSIKEELQEDDISVERYDQIADALSMLKSKRYKKGDTVRAFDTDLKITVTDFYGYDKIAFDEERNVFYTRGDNSNAISKYSLEGNKLWERDIGVNGCDGIIVDNNGNIIHHYNRTITKISPSGSKLWSYSSEYHIEAVEVGDNNSIYFHNSTFHTPNYNHNYGIVKISSNGSKLWSYYMICKVLVYDKKMNHLLCYNSRNSGAYDDKEDFVKISNSGRKISGFYISINYIPKQMIIKDNNNIILSNSSTIWEITQNGEVKFMNNVFPSDTNNILSDDFKNNHIYSLGIDEKGNIYIGGDKKIFKTSNVGNPIWSLKVDDMESRGDIVQKIVIYKDRVFFAINNSKIKELKEDLVIKKDKGE